MALGMAEKRLPTGCPPVCRSVSQRIVVSFCTCAPSLGSQVQPHRWGLCCPQQSLWGTEMGRWASWFREPFLLGWLLKLPWAKGFQESILTVGTVTEEHGSECTVQQEVLPGNTEACVWRCPGSQDSHRSAERTVEVEEGNGRGTFSLSISMSLFTPVSGMFLRYTSGLAQALCSVSPCGAASEGGNWVPLR